MKLGFTGSRTWNDYETFKDIMDNFINCPDQIHINGMCKKGLDDMANLYADENNIKVIKYPADWNNIDLDQTGRREPVVVTVNRFGTPYDQNAGYERNHDIVEQCDILLSFCKKKSKGTTHCTDLALKTYNKPVIMFIIDKDDNIKEIKVTRSVPTNLLKTDNTKYINLVKDFKKGELK